MKVQELRQMLGSAERSRVEKAFVESYKQLKKYQKEEADILIRDILSGQSEKSGVKKEKQSFAELEAQIETFLENAKAGNYYAPNRVIPKSQRPKWRFLVKGYIKELEKIVPGSEHLKGHRYFCVRFMHCCARRAIIICFQRRMLFGRQAGCRTNCFICWCRRHLVADSAKIMLRR